jgi:hypothetical protein
MHLSNAILRTVVTVLCLANCAQAEPMVGLLDTFSGGTTLDWTAGGGLPGIHHPIPPTNVPSGGPAGVDDAYLQATALGTDGAPGGRLSVINRSQWAGDYITAGIAAFTMDVNNFGPDDASIRLLFADADGGPPTNIAITDAILIAAGSGWRHVEFSTDVADLIAVQGDVSAALSNATELRIFHNPDPSFPGPTVGPPAVNLILGVDNIQALPEPSFAPLLVAAILALRRPVRRRHTGPPGCCSV